MSLAYLAQAADHQKIEWLHGGVMSVLLDGDKTNGQLAMVRTHGSAGAAAPVHVHSHEDEVFVVLEGSGIFWVGDQRLQVSTGGVAPRAHAKIKQSHVRPAQRWGESGSNRRPDGSGVRYSAGFTSTR
ncbi:cupin domain-containing protein [Pseudonocardia charpentierae]|uniref:Cupin domain-containing protein n=1 Tax=Pseudonocardia charpentierae TaxID=3075545 RepID=A0ABU2NKC7_9PSEU|nr:cupin domain-containing protein [Pseudonocardia sp. DSM 45834]MDT0353453.1 cupin domain-containing protein [Pseudonocardia sp. DSM 45834]